MSFSARLERELAVREQLHRYRALRRVPGHDFGSNDYLGFATHKELRELLRSQMDGLPLSSSSSRLLPGYHDQHIEAERCFARFVETDAALFFNSGYDANLALLTTLPTRHDVILYDERAHASWYDGARASLADSFKFIHNSTSHLSERLERLEDKGNHQQAFIVIESVYSMDGDLTPLIEIAEIADKHSAVLIVDEAHATGVLGKRGEGLSALLSERTENVITVHTCGKALGAAGAFVAGTGVLIQYLINSARPFIFSTALPPIVPVQIMNSVRMLESDGSGLVKRLRERSEGLRRRLRNRLKTWQVPEGITPIIPILIGSEAAAMDASMYLEQCGFAVPAIRPPSVPAGTSRLRLNVSLRHSDQVLTQLVECIADAEQQSERTTSK